MSESSSGDSTRARRGLFLVVTVMLLFVTWFIIKTSWNEAPPGSVVKKSSQKQPRTDKSKSDVRTGQKKQVSSDENSEESSMREKKKDKSNESDAQNEQLPKKNKKSDKSDRSKKQNQQKPGPDDKLKHSEDKSRQEEEPEKGQETDQDDAKKISKSSENQQTKNKTEQSEPSEPPPYRQKWKQAQKLWKDKKYKKAIQLLEQIRSNHDISDSSLPETLTAWKDEYQEKRNLESIWYEKAKEAKKEKDWDTVVQHLKNALNHLPNSKRSNAMLSTARKKRVFQGMEKIPGGTYKIGSDDIEHHTQKSVSVSTFYIDRYEVRNRSYQTFVQETEHPPPLGWDGTSYPAGKGDHPVTGISYDDAKAYANWAGKQIPSEKQWEVAAIGKTGQTYPWGNQTDDIPANTAELDAGGTASVESHKTGRSPFGVYNLVGNAAEWTSTIARKTDKHIFRVIKGGSFLNTLKQSRPANRVVRKESVELLDTGFRCIKVPGKGE